MRAAFRRGRRDVLARVQPPVLHVPAPGEHAQGHRFPVQPYSGGVAAVPDERRRVRVLFQESPERETAALGYWRVPPLPEATGERIVWDAPYQSGHRLLRALLGDVLVHHVRGKPRKRPFPEALPYPLRRNLKLFSKISPENIIIYKSIDYSHTGAI